jgi:hypothetical protein
MREGALDADHLDVIAKTVNQLPAWVSVADREVVETTLATQARTADAWVVRSLGKELLTRIDQDGPQPDEQESLQPVNSLRYRPTHTGRMVFTSDIDPEAGEELEGLQTALAKPTPNDERARPQCHLVKRSCWRRFRRARRSLGGGRGADVMGGAGVRGL